MSIDSRTAVGRVRLVVADLARAQEFYERAVGLQAMDCSNGLVVLGAGEATAVVELVGRPDAPVRGRGTTGLFHLAILVPSRVELARALRRVGEAGWPLAGASDHLVSEALYLSDPEGNGIEIYRDRPRREWRYSDGMLEMDTRPLDLQGLAAEPGGAGSDTAQVAAETRIGHVHLQVADLGEAEAFYHGVLGFEVTVRGYPGALFFSAGGYHHHIGLNVWAGEWAPPPAPGSRGLERFEILLPDPEELERVEQRLQTAGLAAERDPEGTRVADPSGNRVLLRPGAGSAAG